MIKHSKLFNVESGLKMFVQSVINLRFAYVSSQLKARQWIMKQKFVKCGLEN